MRTTRLGRALWLAFALAGCGDPTPPQPGGSTPHPLAPLRQFELSRRAAADFARVPASDAVMGPDPIALRRLGGREAGASLPPPGAPAFVSVLRGRDALVLLDPSLRELARAPAPASPTAVAVTAQGEVFVGGEASPVILRYAIRGGAGAEAAAPGAPQGASLEPAGRIELAGLHGVRDLAAGPEGVLYALDERSSALLTLKPGSADAEGRVPVERTDEPVGAGPLDVERLERHLIINCLLDHTLIIRPVAQDGRALAEGEARIRHDGPIWSFDAVEVDGGLLVAAGGVEDRPLDRTGGSFGYIDSFVFLYRIAAAAGGGAPEVKLLSAVNVSEIGVITPKALHLRATADAVSAFVTGYGGDRRAALRWEGAPLAVSGAPEVIDHRLAPGTAAMEVLGPDAFVYANPLLDAWILERGGSFTKVPVRDEGAPPRSADSRLGEALFFTSLMAPWNGTEGPLSRFTCETCHFEGYVDGRTHHTGRGDVRATTKPLLGLFNNRPHFSRALDPDLSAVAHNEFRVAGAKSGRDPWFSLSPKDAFWLPELDLGRPELRPEELRIALMTFLMELSHRANPAVLGRLPGSGRSRLTDAERAGAALFRDRCERCHAARLISDDPASAAPFERWEQLLFTREGPLVWGRNGYEKTGVVPYVHESGARVPSLRRLYKKRPYFTNGSAKSLRDVLSRARFGQGTFFHDGAPEGSADLEALDEGAVEALLAFLDLL